MKSPPTSRYRLYLEARTHVLLFIAATVAFFGPSKGTLLAVGAALAIAMLAIVPRRIFPDGIIGRQTCHNLFALDLASSFAISSVFSFNTPLWLGFAVLVHLGFIIHGGRRSGLYYLGIASVLIVGSGLASYLGRYSSNFLFSIPLCAVGFSVAARPFAARQDDAESPGSAAARAYGVYGADGQGAGGQGAEAQSAVFDNIAQLYRTSVATSEEPAQIGIMDILARDAKAIVGTDTASVALFLDKDLLSSVTVGINSEFERRLRWRVRKGGMTDWVLTNGEPLVINDTSSDARSRHSSAVIYGGLSSILAVPLKVKGETIGILYVGERKHRDFAEHDVMLLTILANHAALSVMETRLANELKRKLLELERAHKELVGSDQLKSEFISTVTSQMRMPLDAIRTYSQTVLQRIDDKEFGLKKKFLGAVVEESAKLISTVNSVIDLSRMEFGEGDLRQENVGVRELIKDVCAIHEPVCVEREIDVVVEGGEGDPSAYADKDMMYLLLRNLVEISVSFAKRSTSVRISLGEDDSFLTIRISFQPSPPSIDVAGLFSQVWGSGDVAPEAGSLGLSLQVSKNIVLRHGGRIWAETHDPAGWTLNVLFGKHQRPLIPADLVFDTVRSRPDLKKMLNLVADMVSKAVRADYCFLYLEDTATGQLALEGGNTPPTDETPRAESGRERPGIQSLSQRALETGKPVLLNSEGEEAELEIGINPVPEGYPCALAPLRAGERAIGVIGVSNAGDVTRTFGKEDIALLVALADRIGIAFTRATSYESARNQLVSVMESINRVLEARDVGTSKRPPLEVGKAAR